ncbi:MAG: dicarboxylate/amino acid:cation symporter [Phycisphaerales bacterium]
MAGTLGRKERWVATGSLAALGAGLVVGEALFRNGLSGTVSAFSVAGDLMLVRPLMMLVLPLIFTSVMAGIISLGDPSRLGRLGLATFAYFMATMLVAAALGASLVTLVGPGLGLAPEDVSALKQSGVERFEAAPRLAQAAAAGEEGLAYAWLKIARDMLPANPFSAMAEGQPLGMITFALVLAVAIALGGAATEAAGRVFAALNEALLRAVGWVMWIVPVGAFLLVSASVGRVGLAQLLGPLGMYMAVVIGGLAIHMFVILPAFQLVLGGGNPFRFMWSMREALATAFATASSSATLPVTIRVCETEGGCSQRATRFCAPLGSTLNMDGTALYEAVAVVFLFQLYGVQLSLGELAVVVATATLAAVGAAGIPSAGLVTMVIVITAVNASLGSEKVPVGAMGIVIGVDRLLDMCRTTVNVWGDMGAARVMTRLAPDGPGS